MTPEQLYKDHEKIVYTSINELIKFKHYFCETKRMTIEDLEQYGRLALWKACLKCKDPKRLPSYAYQVVKGAIKDLIFNMTPIHLIKLPYRNSQEERAEISQCVSLHRSADDTDLMMIDLIPSPYEDVEDYVIRKLELEEKLSVMTDKQRSYLVDYLNGYSTTEIAEKNGLKDQYGISVAIRTGVRIHDPDFNISLRRSRRSEKIHD